MKHENDKTDAALEAGVETVIKRIQQETAMLDCPVTNRGLLLAVSYLGEVIKGNHRYSPDCVADALCNLEEELLCDIRSRIDADVEWLQDRLSRRDGQGSDINEADVAKAEYRAALKDPAAHQAAQAWAQRQK